jgi:Predicted phosphoesterases, related to the Icc protein
MKLLYVTDLHGDKKKYEKVLDLAIDSNLKLIINGGDMLPKLGNRHQEQPVFIQAYLRDYFHRLQEHGITYLAMLGNDDLLAVDEIFSTVCGEFYNVHAMAGSKITVGGYEFIGMDSILDHPFGCKDRVVMEKHYVHQPQLSSVVGISNEFDYDRIYNWIEYSMTELPHMCDILN